MLSRSSPWPRNEPDQNIVEEGIPNLKKVALEFETIDRIEHFDSFSRHYYLKKC